MEMTYSLQEPDAAAVLINIDTHDINDLPENLQGSLILTYGMNKKADITISGYFGGSVSICVQRAFVSLCGEVCYPHEIPIPTDDPLQTLADTAAALAISATV
ncbi:MAG: hypothetical protein FWC95_06895 [Defluviitaleaceae bacterium]|nr:hypothetical protein [Defluviitaleaceae bacterium]